LETKARKVRDLAKEMHSDAKVSPDLAATLVAGMNGQTVKIENTTHSAHFPGVPEALRAVGEAIANALAGRNEKEKP
jgi:hypothetical protein